MAHATAEDIRELEDLLAELRQIDGVVEPKMGLFRYRGRPFLHFHRFGDRICFDVRTAGGFRRIDVPSPRDGTSRHQIARQVREALEGLR